MDGILVALLELTGEGTAPRQEMNNLLCGDVTDGPMFVSDRWQLA